MAISGSAGGGSGFKWHRVPGGLKQIDSGPIGRVWGVNKRNQVWCRKGITWKRPAGNRWKRVGGRFKHVSVGQYGVWAITPRNYIRYRIGIRRGVPQGTK